MRTWLKQFIPYLLLLSLAGNLYLGVQIYNQQRYLNLYTWGNSVNAIWKYVAQADMEPTIEPTLDRSPEIRMTLDSVEALRSLPDFDKRIAEGDLRTIEQFLRYAETTYGIARSEQSKTGSVSPESRARLTSVHESLRLLLNAQPATNRAQFAKNPWNHADWRALFHKIAADLREITFAPLPG